MSDNQKNHNDPIERLFKKKAEEYDIAFREEDWNDLAHKLDMRDARAAHRRKLSLLAAASFLIIALLGYFTFENHNRLNRINDQLSTAEPGEIPPQVSEPESGSEREAEGEPEAGGEGDPGMTAVDPDDIRLSPGEGLREAAETETSEEHLLAGAIPYRQFPAADTTVGSLQNFRPSIRFENTEPAGRDLAPAEGEADQPGLIASDFESGTRRRGLSRMTVGLLASPDLSTAGSLTNFEGAGYKFGASVELSLSRNLSVTAGVIQTMVKYSAHSHQYNAPVYWQGGTAPEHVYAECLLFDIPVSLKYNAVNFERSRFFVTAGLSSYIMQDEEYDFSYNEYSPGQLESWSGQTGTRHWFSNAGFSIGYELDLHPQWSLRVEPYIKVPLREVGWGNVKLYSVGSFVSLNYRLF